MRLKIFFFPIILVICICIGLVYIWPELDSLKAANKEYAAKKEQLSSIQSKKVAAGLVVDKLKTDTEGSGLVTNYLPLQESEERIIAELNYIAPGAQISLINISPQKVAPVIDVVGMDKFENSAIPQNNLKLSEMKINVSGSYEKLHGFFDKIQRMTVYNSIKSVSLTPMKTSVSSEGTPAESPDLLSAEIVVDFGFMGQASLSKGNVENFSPTIDSDTIDALKKYIYQQNIVLESGKGTSNPFIR